MAPAAVYRFLAGAALNCVYRVHRFLRARL